MTRPLRWGVLGVSRQVGRLAVLPALQQSPTAELVAVASRDLARAQAEAERFSAATAYGSYRELLLDAAVEAVYIPLPNGLHREWTVAALQAGKHVLCEKPLAPSAADAEAMAAAAARQGVFLMEAYMTAFHPRSARILELARQALGELRFAHAAFTFPARDPSNHRWRPELGGGSLLDVGVYCLAPLLAIAGREPRAVQARAVLSPSGVDASCAAWLDFGAGFAAACETSFEAPERQHFEVVGTRAALSVERAFTPGPADDQVTLQPVDGPAERLTTGANNPYLAMVEQFAAAVRGQAASLRSVADSIATLRVLDRLRQVAGLATPERPT